MDTNCISVVTGNEVWTASVSFLKCGTRQDGPQGWADSDKSVEPEIAWFFFYLQNSEVKRLALMVFIAVLACSSVATGKTLTQTCAQPSFPSKVTPIDSACDVAGQGGEEAAQNEAKNNFCAQDDPESYGFDKLKRLEVQVENDRSIPFGKTGRGEFWKRETSL